MPTPEPALTPAPTTHDDPRSDESLLAAAQAGDHAAFAALYHRHKDWVVSLAHGFTGDREIALDTLQETFTYLLRKLPTLRLTAKLTTFLYPVVKHTAIAARKKRPLTLSAISTSNDPALSPATPHPSAPTHPNNLTDPETLRAAIDRLPAAQREVVVMRYVAAMSLADIAAAVNKPLGTVKSNLHHAMNTLERAIAAPDSAQQSPGR